MSRSQLRTAPNSVDISTPFTGSPRIRPENAALPSDFPPPHPEAVGSHGDDAVEWIEARMLADDGAEGDDLLWHQWLILQRALEYRADGTLCWPLVLVTMMRQQGKTVLLAELALWRSGHPELFGEVQRVLHAARNVGLANEMQDAARRWAEDLGLRVTKRVADSMIKWPDGSHWHVKALGAVWGQRVGMALLDEGWDMSPEAFWSGLWPAMGARRMRQAWVFSAANDGDRGLLRSLRTHGAVLVVRWGARNGDDYQDEALWHAVTPCMTPDRLEAMRLASRAPGFEVEWLNVDPLDDEVAAGWPSGLAECPKNGQEAPSGCVGALEVSQDATRYGIALARREGDRTMVWTDHFAELKDAVAALERNDPVMVLVGLGLKDRVAGIGAFMQIGAGLAETRLATPIFATLVKRGLVSHDHSEALMNESLSARVAEVESGPMLSAKRSKSGISVLKSAVWAAWAADSGLYDNEAPAIW